MTKQMYQCPKCGNERNLAVGERQVCKCDGREHDMRPMGCQHPRHLGYSWHDRDGAAVAYCCACDRMREVRP